MAKDNGQEPKIEQEMLEELKRSSGPDTPNIMAQASPEERVRGFAEALAGLQQMYGVVLAVVTKNVTPTYTVTELQILPREKIQQG